MADTHTHTLYHKLIHLVVRNPRARNFLGVTVNALNAVQTTETWYSLHQPHRNVSETWRSAAAASDSRDAYGSALYKCTFDIDTDIDKRIKIRHNAPNCTTLDLKSAAVRILTDEGIICM